MEVVFDGRDMSNFFIQTVNVALALTITQLELDQLRSDLIGISFDTCADLWNLIRPVELFRGKAHPRHIFYALILLKCDGSYEAKAELAGRTSRCDFIKWSWLLIDAIQRLGKSMICIENRFDGWNGKSECLVCLDSLNCEVKDNRGKTFKYFLGMSINNSGIAWVEGP